MTKCVALFQDHPVYNVYNNIRHIKSYTTCTSWLIRWQIGPLISRLYIAARRDVKVTKCQVVTYWINDSLAEIPFGKHSSHDQSALFNNAHSQW